MRPTKTKRMKLLREEFREVNYLLMEYRDYIIDIVRTYEDKFGESSLYTNIKDINQKWLRE